MAYVWTIAREEQWLRAYMKLYGVSRGAAEVFMGRAQAKGVDPTELPARARWQEENPE
jgi:hypothetical protein